MTCLPVAATQKGVPKPPQAHLSSSIRQFNLACFGNTGSSLPKEGLKMPHSALVSIRPGEWTGLSCMMEAEPGCDFLE